MYIRVALIVALIALGLVLGFVLGWAFNVGATQSLFVGILLVAAGAIAGFVVEWIIDEAIRKNRELGNQLIERQSSNHNQPIVVEGNVIPQSRDTELLMEAVQQLRAIRETPVVAAGAPAQNQDNVVLNEILQQLRALRETPAVAAGPPAQNQDNVILSEILQQLRTMRETPTQNQDNLILTEILQQLRSLRESSPVAAPAQDDSRMNEILHQLRTLRETPPVAVAAAVPTRQSPDEDSAALAQILREHNTELHQIGEQLSAKDAELEQLRASFDAYQKSHPDELTQIKGIGPVFQRKLRDIGFSSYSQLAKADPDQIKRMLGIKNWQKVDIESWVQQAQDWAEHS